MALFNIRIGLKHRIAASGVVGVLVTTVAALAFFIRRMVSQPITAMTGAMHELADGHLPVAIPSAGRGDEIN
jgi:hypothetical protein